MLTAERLLCRGLNGGLRALYRREYLRFQSIRDVEEVQTQKLLQLLRDNQESRFGTEHGFASIRTVEEYRRQVPLASYEDYLPMIERIAAGEQQVLTGEPVLLFEPTGGSSGGSKLIPYTRSLKEEMQRGIRPWLYDMFTSYPQIMWGRSYWSVTPATAERTHTSGGLPIGFEDDTDYFGRLEKHLLRRLFAVPQELVRETDMEAFYFRTSLALLNCRCLTLVSVWNPTYFLLLLDYMQQNRDRLLKALPQKRAKSIATHLQCGSFSEVWPYLRLISCWCDANATPYAEKLSRRFPHTAIQPKGVLATEGILSIPLEGDEGACLSVRSHFYEFIRQEDGGLCLAHELEQGKVYEVVMTTGGGLYRYRIGDLVRVTGYRGSVPLFQFTGRGNRCSDLFGEKLQEAFVKQMLTHFGLTGEFALLAPETTRYVLYCREHPGLPHPEEMDQYLRKNVHYDYCRKLGQLGPLRIFALTGNPEQEYLSGCMARGQKLGDIKPALLVPCGGWTGFFTGFYREETAAPGRLPEEV